MKCLGPTLAILVSLAVPVRAESPAPSAEEGLSLLEQGARMLLESVLTEMEPALKDLHEGLGEAMRDMGPELRRLAEIIGDLGNYEPPVRLPNGDILLRRKPETLPPAPLPDGEIEL